MTNSVPNPTIEPQPTPSAASSEPARVKTTNLRKMITLAREVRYLPGGERVFVRFHQPEIIEHWILLVNFAILAITGLLEMFANNRISAEFLAPVFRNMDYVRGLHNVAAVFYAGMMALHVLFALARWFVKRENPVLLPTRKDWQEFLRHWRYLLGRTYPRPEYGRFNIDQKVTYWMVASFSTLMLITALIMWFQTLIAQILPDTILPASRTIHSMMGLLIVVTFLPWHIYHTVIKERNSSIFSGVLDEKTIQRNHPLDYKQIMEAAAAFRTFSNIASSPKTQQLESTAEQPEVQGTATEALHSGDTPKDTLVKRKPL
jgi:formate dehydrogenase gamma subunit